jgi:hypothetical protein
LALPVNNRGGAIVISSALSIDQGLEAYLLA